MTLHQEALIEAFALDSGSLSPAEHEEASILITESEEASALFLYFERFYQSFEIGSEERYSTWVHDFVERIMGRAGLVLLRPRRTVMRDTRTGMVATPRLAAATTMHRAFELLGSSISDDGLINVRFIMDHDAGKVRIYVVTQDARLRANALLLFKGSSIMLMANDSGQTALDRDLFDQLGLVELPILLRPVSAEFAIAPKELGTELSRIGPNSLPLKGRNHAEKVCLSFHPEHGVLFGRTLNDTSWKHVHPESCIPASEHRDQVIQFRWYV